MHHTNDGSQLLTDGQTLLKMPVHGKLLQLLSNSCYAKRRLSLSISVFCDVKMMGLPIRGLIQQQIFTFFCNELIERSFRS